MDTPSVPQKRCSKCGIPKANTTEFYRQRRGYNGKPYLLGKCRCCEALEAKAIREANPSKTREIKQRCRAKYRDVHILYMQKWHARNHEYDERYNEEHREETRARGRQWRKDNPERSLAYVHQRRARLCNNGGAYTKDDLSLQIRSQTGKDGILRCWWCGKPIKEKYHIDHRIPLARGGSNAPSNLCVVHPRCNLAKADKLPQEWNGRLL